MRYFDDQLIANHPRHHGLWWNEVCVNREWFHQSEETFAGLHNSSAVLPRDAWLEMDDVTRRVMRDDGGDVYMADLMALAKPVNIGKLVHLNRVSGDAGVVQRSMSGQVPNPLDKVNYDYRGSPVPIFSSAYGREWREWNTLKSESFDALSDDQEAITYKLKSNMADYVLDGDSNIVFEGYTAYGIRTSTLSKSINLGSAGGGYNIDLTASGTTSDAIDTFITMGLGDLLDDNLVNERVNLYVSPEIGRRLDQTYSGSAGFKGGSMYEYLIKNRRINKIAVTYKLSGNAFFGFVPSPHYIRPLIGMAVNTTAMARLNPTDNYQFLVMGAMGLEIRADINGKSGVFYSVDQD